MVVGAMGTSAQSESLRKKAEHHAPWVVSFLDDCGFSEFPEVSHFDNVLIFVSASIV